MGEVPAISSNSWSTLSTVNTIDDGSEATEKDIISKTGGLSKPNAKSLFIESLVDQLCKLLEKDPFRRKMIYEGICAKLYEMKLVDETYQFEEFASLRGCYQQAMIHLFRTPDSSLYKIPTYNFEWSRYLNEYEELNFIARGGFGKVYKAKHRLDQVFYAVKKITFKFQSMSVFIMESNEVKTLAKLNHPNIVQYKAAWLELEPQHVSPALPRNDVLQSSSSGSDEIFFQGSKSSSDNECTSVCEENENNMVLCKYNKNEFPHKKLPQLNAVLYVSMQLCDETLREWLYKRNTTTDDIDLPLCMDIMIQAAKGLEYIHSSNIVHHDIKPSNIFLSNNLKTVQVGDFGLACSLQEHAEPSCPLEDGRFGTLLYAAPEQKRRQCNFKSDMYSLGLVFIEIVSIFATDMERIAVLTKSRSGDLPHNIPKELVPIIKHLLSSEAEERPTSSELLKMLYKVVNKPNETKILSVTKTQLISLNENDLVSKTEENVVSNFNEVLRIKDNEIRELKLMLAKRDDEIAQLKQRIIHKF